MPDVNAFIARWEASGAAERANYGLFFSELCDLLEVPRPEPTREDDADNAYVFERRVPLVREGGESTVGRIDLYRRGCFVAEAKQGSSAVQETPLFGAAPAPSRRGTARRGTTGWDEAMQRAKNQAERYARALPAEEGRPPFLMVVDIGHAIELYSEFSRTGGDYVPFPDPQNHRILLEDLRDEEKRERLRKVWTEPLSLDPAKRSAKVTREIADRLARLAKSLEAAAHPPDEVASFLMRVLFTMFAEDVGLLPKNAFRNLLESIRGDAAHFREIIEPLWETMNRGGYSRDLRREVLRFNGGLFADPSALPVTEDQLALLIEAAKADWREVEPTIFGTLLERALDPRERHKLGAHYTPRAYVERLVIPTVVAPLRSDWKGVQAAAATHLLKGNERAALKELRTFHQRLCSLRILDPACGSGNFLYVTLEHLKRLEGEVLEAIADLSGNEQIGLEMQGVTVSPEQFLGLEVNPRAAKIAELVLWIGYLQWHFRTRGDALPPEPVIRDFKNIACRDAVLAYSGVEVATDDEGQPITRWDGQTFKRHPVTGEEVPDESARVEELRYLEPREAEWPEADFVVGNPPFIGNWRMRSALGDGYTEALRKTYKTVPETSDFVMYWWHKAADLAREGEVQRFGFITTNSLKQTFNRKVLQHHMTAKPPLSLRCAVPDHPWVDAADGAAVRVAMTVAGAGEGEGVLERVVSERETGELEHEVVLEAKQGVIYPDLTIGADVSGAVALKANKDVSNPGVKLHGSGFIVTKEEATTLGLGEVEGLEEHIRLYRNGRDLTQTSRDVMVIDLFGLTADEVRKAYPAVYQHVIHTVKPERDTNKRKTRRENWWIFGEPNPKLRSQLAGLNRYIATVETAKHRFFVFLDRSILPDNMLVNIALEDAYFLGVLSSRVHVAWALAAGGTLEDRPRYNKTRCFDPFPFPNVTEERKGHVRDLAEALDAHRKRQLEQHPKLTMTGMYNVLEKLRSGEALDDKERDVHAQGLVSVLKEIHDDLDQAVLEAYGWPVDLPDEEILERLVALNGERAAEEAQGLVRWLRPEYQNPEGAAQQGGMELEVAPVAVTTLTRQPWPRSLPEQAQVVRNLVLEAEMPLSSGEVARAFKGSRKDKVEELLVTLEGLGQVHRLEDGRFLQ